MATKRKHSIFCLKNPSVEGMVFGAVHIKNENTWTLVKGKSYKNGYFRYIHNGIEAKVSRYNWKSFKGLSYSQMESEITALNINSIPVPAKEYISSAEYTSWYPNFTFSTRPLSTRMISTVLEESAVNELPDRETESHVTPNTTP